VTATGTNTDICIIQSVKQFPDFAQHSGYRGNIAKHTTILKRGDIMIIGLAILIGIALIFYSAWNDYKGGDI